MLLQQGVDVDEIFLHGKEHRTSWGGAQTTKYATVQPLSTSANVKIVWCITSTSSYTFKVHELSLPVPCYYFTYSNEKWAPGHARVQGNWIPDELARDGSALKFDGPKPALGVSRQQTRRRIRRWMVNQHWVRWWGLGDIQRRAQELISGPCLGAKARFLPFNRTQSRAVTGLLTGHSTLRRHLHLIGLSDSPLRRRCGAEDETSAFIVCECEALASLWHVYLGSFFLGPEDIRSISVGSFWNYNKVKGPPQIDMGYKGPVK